jgi:uncharacterized cupin superfamily protein
VKEARLEETGAGLAAAEDGWFTVNVRDGAWMRWDPFAARTVLDGPQRRFAELGINVRVLQPGQSSGLYHAEAAQENFLVLGGECLLIVEEQERRLRAWDFVHCPPRTAHVFVGAGDAPCVVLMVGARIPGRAIEYPDSELAVRHGAGVEGGASSPQEAYAPYGEPVPGRPPGWEQLPWATGA